MESIKYGKIVVEIQQKGMIHMATKNRLVSDLEFGDIILANMAFEENTRDYYQGYPVYHIINDAITDEFGRTSKIRPVVIMGRTDNQVFVAPLTSQNGSNYDFEHQLQLKDTAEMLKDVDNSFIEVTDVRRVFLEPSYEVPYLTKLGNMDTKNLVEKYETKFQTRAFNNPIKDTHTYIPNEDSFYKYWENEGYKRKGDTLSKDNHSITLHDGIASSHYDVSKEEVLKRTHKHSTFTLRTSTHREPCSPQIDLLVDDVRELLHPIPLDFKSTNKLPTALDAKTTPGRTRIQLLAACDHGAVSELGKLILKLNKLSEDLLPQFVTWYETEHRLTVVNPTKVEYDFSNLGLSEMISEQELADMSKNDIMEL